MIMRFEYGVVVCSFLVWRVVLWMRVVFARSIVVSNVVDRSCVFSFVVGVLIRAKPERKPERKPEQKPERKPELNASSVAAQE